MLTDCSSIQGSTTSSSSDVMTLTTASSWCAIPASSRMRVLRLIRPHTRRILVTPDSNPSFGFAVRGGKEFGTGFFVSNVERNSEADSKGMRSGDQILRINGFRVDDAVHKEFVQFVSSQDRITLKVRSVGMLPIKDKDADSLSWHVVKTTSVSNTPSESSYKSAPESSASSSRDLRNKNKDISVVLNVAPRTKLGLGICKGPEWKPGIFVQFTKDKSVARESGLRPGDQILSVNSIDFSDVLFSEAVAVMKGSNKLEMRVRTAAGCDLFPGESSGYNSSASSVTGDQSPCWADAKSKRLTAVREEPNAACWNEPMYAAAEQRRSNDVSSSQATIRELPPAKANSNASASVPAGKELNKTIIKLSENGTSINNTYIANTQPRKAMTTTTQQQLPSKMINASSTSSPSLKSTGVGQSAATVMPPPPPPPVNFNLLQSQTQDEADCCPKTAQNLADICFVSRQSETKTVVVEVHRNAAQAATDEEKHQRRRQQAMTLQRGKLLSNNSSSTALKTPTIAAEAATITTTATSALKAATTAAMAMGPPKAPVFSNCRNRDATYNNNSNFSNIASSSDNNNYDIGGSTLSSAISEELKKRKEKQKQQAASSIANNNNINNSQINCRHKLSCSSSSGEQQQQLALETATLRQRVCRASSNAANCSERSSSSGGVGDQHSALMDEFKRAHQRMFRNGFHESERRNKERQEALKRTTIMEDDVNHRTASRNFITESAKTSNEPQAASVNMAAQQNGQQTTHIPPPPPQFANSPPKATTTTHSNISSYKALQKTINASTPPAKQPQQHTTAAYHRQQQQQEPKPPSSPVPDYDNVQIRSAAPAAPRYHAYSYAAPPSSNNSVVTNAPPTSSTSTTGNRRTMRLGTVTIGEYTDPNQQLMKRKEPAKFDFIAAAAPQKHNEDNTVHPESLRTELQNTLSRSNLKKPMNGHSSAAVHTQHQSNCPLQRQEQNYENVEAKSGGSSVESLTRKLQNAGFGGGRVGMEASSVSNTVPQLRNGHSNGSTGILKNGSRNSGAGSFSKPTTEKTITFGN